MSGFRKFRTTLQRRRRSEMLELGHLRPGTAPGLGAVAASLPRAETESTPLEFSPSIEAKEIGPRPIAWLKPNKPETDH